MKKIFATVVMLLAALTMSAENRLFENAWNAVPDKESVFKTGGDWLPYPDYKDRAAWDDFLGEKLKKTLVGSGEDYLNYKCHVLPASVFLEFEKTGNRGLMKNESTNRYALDRLILAELAEGKGRFIPKIADIVMFECTRFNWSHAAHTTRQPNHRCLPTPEYSAITLHTGYYAASVSVAWHYFHEAFDKIDPVISQTIRETIRKKIIEPYMSDWYAQNFHPWMGIAAQTHSINNWNCTCNTDMLIVFLLMEQDQKELNRELERLFRVFDNYLSFIHQDGCCDEGPGYWEMASGKFYCFSHYVYYASKGCIDVSSDPLLRKAGEFKSKTDLGDGWVMDYGDGGARTNSSPYLIWRYGKFIDDREMIDYSMYKMANADRKRMEIGSLPYSEIMSALEYVHFYKEVKADQEEYLEAAGGDYDELKRSLRTNVTSVWYDETQQAVLRNNKGWSLCCKGGTNDESHNHNDSGSCILFVDECPVLIDPGNKTYSKNTFGPHRYEDWAYSSLSHNVPKINGYVQKAGVIYRTSNVSCDPQAGTLTCDIAGVYPEEAACESWIRTYSIDDAKVVINDDYSLRERIASDEIRFMVRADVKINAGKRTVEIVSPSYKGDRSVKMILSYPKDFSASVEETKITDKKLGNTWGEVLRTVVLKSSDNAPLRGTYTVTVTKAKK